MKYSSILVAAALMTLVVAHLPVAATPADGEDEPAVVGGLAFLDRVEVTVVNVDVFVRGRDGSPVTGLGIDDFRLLQDGMPQRISHFAAFTEEVVRAVTEGEATVGAAPAPEEARPESTPRREDVQPVYIVLFVDNENIQPLDRTRVLAQVRQFISQVMLPHVQVMVVSGERSVRVLQPFTNDPGLVREALRAMGKLAGARVEMDGQRRQIIGDLQRHIERGRSDRMNDYQSWAQLEGQVRSYGEQLAMEVDEAIYKVRETAMMVAGLKGRKIMIHVSSGLPMVAAKDLLDNLGTLFERASTLPMLSRFDRSRSFRSLAATANAQGLSFYTIDATGLGGVGGVSAEYARPIDPMVAGIHVNNMQEPLVYLADRTGGRAILDANDVTRGLLELKQDLFTYYSLGYTISASGADVVHVLDVRLPEHPSHKVVHRRTFVEKSRETEVQETVATSLVLEVEDNPMAISLVAGAGRPATEDRFMVPIEVSVPVTAVALVPEGDDLVGRIVVLVASRDADGRQSDVQRLAVDLRYPMSGALERAGDRHVVEVQLLTRSGLHRIAVGVLDVVTRQASFTTTTRMVP